MFSACEALKMHLSDDTALSSKEMVCSLYSSAFEQLKVNLYVCVCLRVCVCVCVRAHLIVCRCYGCGQMRGQEVFKYVI